MRRDKGIKGMSSQAKISFHIHSSWTETDQSQVLHEDAK